MSASGRRPVASQPPPGAAALRFSGISAARRTELRRKYPTAYAGETVRSGETAESIAQECAQLKREVASNREAAAIDREITRLTREAAADRAASARDRELARLQREVDAERKALARERAALAKEKGIPAAALPRRGTTEQQRINRRNGISAAREAELQKRHPSAYPGERGR